MKIYKSFTFWFAIASITIILMNVVGLDYKDIILTFSNCPLHIILKATGFTLYTPMASDHSYYFQHLFLWFRWHFISFICYGLTLDTIRAIIEKRKTNLAR